MVLRDGTLRGGDSFFYAYGTYTSAERKMEGRSHQTRSIRRHLEARPNWERKVVTIGFTGTYTDDSAEGDGMALAGKQAIRFKSKLRLPESGLNVSPRHAPLTCGVPAKRYRLQADISKRSFDLNRMACLPASAMPSPSAESSV